VIKAGQTDDIPPVVVAKDVSEFDMVLLFGDSGWVPVVVLNVVNAVHWAWSSPGELKRAVEATKSRGWVGICREVRNLTPWDGQ
jgi:hypothetical protein